MRRIALDQDIRPLSEFRANAASLVQQVRQTRRPLVLTQHGRSAAVLLDVAEYEALMERLDLLEDVQAAEEQISAGKGVAHGEVKRQLLKRYRT